MKNNIVLLLGIFLLVFGFFGNKIPNLSSPAKAPVLESYVVDAPSDINLLAKAQEVIKALEQSSDSTKKMDCLKLSALYSDIAVLIELDQEDTVIKDTAAIRTANSLSGKMLRLDIKDKYPNLASKTKDVVVAAIGEDDVLLDDDSRSKAASAFRALSWAFYEGSK